MLRVDILGQEYVIVDDGSILKDGLDGMAQSYDHVIRVRPLNELLSETEDINTKKAYRRELIRHEIMHCVFRECGLEQWQNDEDLVTWISIMYPKLNKIFGEIGCST